MEGGRQEGKKAGRERGREGDREGGRKGKEERIIIYGTQSILAYLRQTILLRYFTIDRLLV